MLDQAGTLYLVDWDTLRIAPRERDFLFIIGSTIARRVTPEDEVCFFEGYGAARINWQAITYYRYERVLEELYTGGHSVFFTPWSSVAVKEADAQFTMSLFQPGGMVQWAIEADGESGSE
jgi:spectinomycin phosphotransferase